MRQEGLSQDAAESCRYGFERAFETVTVDEALSKVTAALKREGFGILTQIDVKDAFKNKLNVEFRRYLILGACNPVLARKALTTDPQIGLLLPCNVVVQEAAKGGVVVSIADPRAMFTLVDNPELKHVADEAEERLRRVIEGLA